MWGPYSQLWKWYSRWTQEWGLKELVMIVSCETFSTLRCSFSNLSATKTWNPLLFMDSNMVPLLQALQLLQFCFSTKQEKEQIFLAQIQDWNTAVEIQNLLQFGCARQARQSSCSNRKISTFPPVLPLPAAAIGWLCSKIRQYSMHS